MHPSLIRKLRVVAYLLLLFTYSWYTSQKNPQINSMWLTSQPDTADVTILDLNSLESNTIASVVPHSAGDGSKKSTTSSHQQQIHSATPLIKVKKSTTSSHQQLRGVTPLTKVRRKPHTTPADTIYVLGNPQWTFSVKPKRLNGTDGELISERDQEALWYVDKYIDSSSYQFTCSQHLVVVMIESSPQNSKQRHLIRRTWGHEWSSQADDSGYSILRTLFVLGKSESIEVNALVLNESIAYGDIIIGNFTDHYGNLTIKSLFGIQMVNEICQFSFLFKTDDDCFVNSQLLVSNIEHMDNDGDGHTYIGKRGSKYPNKDVKTKWFLSKEDYPFKELAPFILGGGYLLSALTAQTLLQQYKYTPFIVNEDVFIGYALSRSDVKACWVPGFYEVSANFTDVCSLNRIFSIHRKKHLSADEILKLYNNSLEAAYSKHCSHSNDIIKRFCR